MSVKKTHTVVFQNETIKARTRCENFGNPSDCESCKKCCAANNQIGFACHVKASEELVEAKEAIEPKKEKLALEELKEMFSEDELKAMLQELVGEPESIKETAEPNNIKRRKGTKLHRLKELVTKGIYTKKELAEQLRASVGTLNVYLTKLRKEFGMLIDTPKDGLVTCAA